ncbi:MAG: hypothetical protein QM811_25080 [Pirellulales bacterium]
MSNRRQFLGIAAAWASATVWASRAQGALRRRVALSDGPFQCGIASGDPTADGFVIWTRLGSQADRRGRHARRERRRRLASGRRRSDDQSR